MVPGKLGPRKVAYTVASADNASLPVTEVLIWVAIPRGTVSAPGDTSRDRPERRYWTSVSGWALTKEERYRRTKVICIINDIHLANVNSRTNLVF